MERQRWTSQHQDVISGYPGDENEGCDTQLITSLIMVYLRYDRDKIMDATRLRNYLATLKISPGSCVGFEDDALAACLGLVFYFQGSHGQRSAWSMAVQNASINSAGTTQAGPKNQSFFYHAVLSRKNAAFGLGIDARKPADIDIVAYPWTLPEAVFRHLDAQVQKGQGLAGRPMTSWTTLVSKATDFQSAHGLSTPVAIFAGVMLNKFVTKYAPKMAALLLGPEVAAGAAAAAFGGLALNNLSVRLGNAEVRANFAADRTRRDYDKNAASNMIAGRQ